MQQPQPQYQTHLSPAAHGNYEIKNHDAVNGVTGSCHELSYSLNHNHTGVLIDCGLFQGAETQEHAEQSNAELDDTIPFDISNIKALVVTHVHIDHVGRIPYLLAKGFNGPIYCSEVSAKLLPLVLEDAIKIGFTRNHRYVQKFVKHVQALIQPLAYNKWQTLDEKLKIKLKPAGYILGSAYVICKLSSTKTAVKPVAREKYLTPVRGRLRATDKAKTKTIVFSGDLGAPHSPILKAPRPPFGCDVLVMESTYGDKNHENRRKRRQRLKAIIERVLQNQGFIINPAFSIGRTQELLYELEEIIHQETVGVSLLANKPSTNVNLNDPASVGASLLAKKSQTAHAAETPNGSPSKVHWQNLEVILDSPLAAKFTHAIGQLKHCWDAEALRKVKMGRRPLTFDNLTTISTHKEHVQTVEYLANNKRLAIIITTSDMCTGGRVMNYLKAMLGDARHDVLFVGYQTSGTIGRLIQKYGLGGGYVTIDGKK